MAGPIKAGLKLYLPDFLPPDRWVYRIERQDYQHITGFTMTRERLEDAEFPPNTSFEHVIAWMDALADEWYAVELREAMGEPTQQESLAEEPRDAAAETEADILQETVGTLATMIDATTVAWPWPLWALDFSNSSKASASAEGSIALPASSDTLLEHLKELGFKAKLKMLPKSDHAAPVTVVNPPSASEGAPSYITFNGQTFAVKNFKVIPSKDDPTGPGPFIFGVDFAKGPSMTLVQNFCEKVKGPITLVLSDTPVDSSNVLLQVNDSAGTPFHDYTVAMFPTYIRLNFISPFSGKVTVSW